MVYVFVDESYRGLEGKQRYIVCCSAFYQARWSTVYCDALKIGESGKTARLDRIRKLLEKANGLGVIAYADIDYHLTPSGEVDSTLDVPAMMRVDNLWSQCVVFAIGQTIKSLLQRSLVFKTVDIFYDPKSLKQAHREAFKAILKKDLRDIASQYVHQHNLNFRETVRVRRIVEVPKEEDPKKANKFQVGTNLSHRICAFTAIS